MSQAATQTCGAGIVALAVAVGIGRFAFTPLLPIMLRDGTVGLAAGSWLATANYIGYLVGALLCMALPRRLSGAVLVRAGLSATAALTLAMALATPSLWPLLRFLAGIASAVTLIFTSGWCFGRLTSLGAPALGVVIFAGPGIGIVVSGLAATLLSHVATARVEWLAFGGLAAVLSAVVWPVFRPIDADPPRVAAPITARIADSGMAPRMALLAAGYGLAGFGYIVTATFLPVIASLALPGSPWLGLFWPMFGTGAVVGSVASAWVSARADRRFLLLGCHACQAIGVGLGAVAPTVAGFMLGSLLAGLPFTAISAFALQEARSLRPQQAARFIGLLTAVYGLGQIAGPPLVALLLGHAHTQAGGFATALAIAAAALLLGGLLYVLLPRPRIHQALR
jgi:MFS family permease